MSRLEPVHIKDLVLELNSDDAYTAQDLKDDVQKEMAGATLELSVGDELVESGDTLYALKRVRVCLNIEREDFLIEGQTVYREVSIDDAIFTILSPNMTDTNFMANLKFWFIKCALVVREDGIQVKPTICLPGLLRARICILVSRSATMPLPLTSSLIENIRENKMQGIWTSNETEKLIEGFFVHGYKSDRFSAIFRDPAFNSIFSCRKKHETLRYKWARMRGGRGLDGLITQHHRQLHRILEKVHAHFERRVGERLYRREEAHWAHALDAEEGFAALLADTSLSDTPFMERVVDIASQAVNFVEHEGAVAEE